MLIGTGKRGQDRVNAEKCTIQMMLLIMLGVDRPNGMLVCCSISMTNRTWKMKSDDAVTPICANDKQFMMF